jgi:type IV secretory pathway VirB3-like protein
MGIGVSIFLLALGAIMTFALNVTVSGIDLDTVGVILMVVGLIGLAFSAMFWNSWGGFGGASRTERTVVRDREVI